MGSATNHASNLQNLTSFLETQTGQTSKSFGMIGMTQVDNEVGAEASIGEKLLIDFGRIKTTHGSAIESMCTSCKHEVSATQGAVSRCSARCQCSIAFKHRFGIGFHGESNGQMLVKMIVSGNDHGDRC